MNTIFASELNGNHVRLKLHCTLMLNCKLHRPGLFMMHLSLHRPLRSLYSFALTLLVCMCILRLARRQLTTATRTWIARINCHDSRCELHPASHRYSSSLSVVIPCTQITSTQCAVVCCPPLATNSIKHPWTNRNRVKRAKRSQNTGQFTNATQHQF